MTLLARYEYDALGRRIICENPVSGVTLQYYYDGQSVIEERNASGTVIRTHVHGGQYIDEHIVTIPGTTGSGKTANDDESYYYLLNDLYTVVALGDEEGNIAEDYEYSASGLSEIGDGRGCLPGDMDGDGVRDLADVTIFEWVLETGDGTARMLCAADMNEDGEVNGKDIQPFLDCVVYGNCPLHPASTPRTNTPYTLHGRPVDRLSDGLTLQYNRARYYDITNGRWLQRDPKGYVDGGNLYEAFGGNPASYVDPEGLWKIIRAGASQASAEAEPDDNIETLAEAIGLDTEEWRDWLDVPGNQITTDAGTSISINNPLFSKCTTILPGEIVYIPNTVMAYWGGELGSFGRFWVMWHMDKRTLRDRGFLVIEMKHMTGRGFDKAITQLMDSKELHGLFYWGHGSRRGVTTDSKKMRTWLGRWYSTDYASWQPRYRMGLGILFACETAAARKQFSDNAIFWGKKGTLIPHGFHLFGPTIRELLQPGAQGTIK